MPAQVLLPIASHRWNAVGLVVAAVCDCWLAVAADYVADAAVAAGAVVNSHLSCGH